MANRRRPPRLLGPQDGGSSQGPSIDSGGTPVVDPTKNVMDMVDAAIQRQDDLRYQDRQHIREVINLVREYEQKLAVQEAARIDAIRSVDVAAGARAAEVSAVQASTLASQVAAAAEAMRNQVAAAAAAAATALATALAPIQESINDLRKAQYEQQGQRVAQTEGREVKQDNQSNVLAVVAIAITLLFGLAGVIFGILKTM